MKSEDIIMIAFMVIMVVGIPLLLWYINYEKKQEEKRLQSEWKRKNFEKTKKTN